MVKAAVSRQREYLADASAVQYTRQSAGLVGALKKIAGLPGGSTVDNARSEEVSHMLFGERTRTHSRFATHPPLAQRIRVLDPTFDPAELTRLAARWKDTPPSGAEEDRALGLDSTPGLVQLAALGEPIDPLGDLHPMLRLPLAELAFPLLRGRPDVLARVDALIAADDRVEIFEYCLSRLLRGPVAPAPARPLAEAEREVAVLMSVLEGASVTALDDVWPVLAGLAGRDKQSVVAGMVTVLSHDGVMTVSEIELLRTVCAMLHCPLPPLGPDTRK